MEDTFKTKLKELVIGSELADEKKSLWDLFLQISVPEENEAVYEAVAENVDNLKLLTEHLEGKIWSLKETNGNAWRRLTASQGEEAGEL